MTKQYVCAMCGTRREASDMATEMSNHRTRRFCHPFDAKGTTCYMKYVMSPITRSLVRR